MKIYVRTMLVSHPANCLLTNVIKNREGFTLDPVILLNKKIPTRTKTDNFTGVSGGSPSPYRSLLQKFTKIKSAQ